MVDRLEKELGISVGLSDWDKFYQALCTFKQVKGNLKVLARFNIPEEEPWPEDLWGYRLGVRVGNLRTTGMCVCVCVRERSPGRRICGGIGWGCALGI